MFLLFAPLFTYAAVAFGTVLFFYYGVFRPLCSLLRFFISLLYYAIMLAGFYFLFTMIWPISSNSDQMDSFGRNNSLSDDTAGEAMLDGLNINLLFKVIKMATKAVAKFVVTILD
ncbi:hypothetical protein niasHT_003780 [Heterodera trifolii]|uniref:Uncharacterized protein n=1 Tax=Heterodera trifolii TaxID=157864 RepID=A0ABD2LUS8_9BILA